MRLPLRLCTLAFVALTGLAACGDELTGPEGVLDAADADGILRAAEALPTVPRLVALQTGPADSRQDAGSELRQAVLEWEAAGDAGGDVALRRRRVAARRAAPELARRLDSREWETVRGQLVDWISTAEIMLRHLDLDDVDAHLGTARGYIGQAEVIEESPERARLLLLAAAELSQTTPRAVAGSLVNSAEQALASAGTGAAGMAGYARSQVDGESGADRESGADGETEAHGETGNRAELDRARRLTHWARRALADGDYLMAAQRAYYARQLAEGR